MADWAMITLKEGDKAPAFAGKDQDGKNISLAGYKGKKLVLYFYSEAGSPTCTIESCNLRDNYARLRKNGFDVLGVSPDNEKAQKRFEIKYKLPFPLIADNENKVTAAYGVWDMKNCSAGNIWAYFALLLLLMKRALSEKYFRSQRI
jgi:thioredoxin-dependent peroxiredoxin